MKKTIKKEILYLAGAQIVKEMECRGWIAYFAGGFVRDLILGRTIKDIDIATNASPDEVEKIFPNTFETGKAFGVVNVMWNDLRFEVASFRQEREYSDGRHPNSVTYTDDPVIDSKRRDFTINSMFYSPTTEEIMDFQGGLNDLRLGIIRTVGDPLKRFEEDHLRIMRAVRFAAEFSFDIEYNTEQAMKLDVGLLKKISTERIRDEIDKMLRGFDPSRAISKLCEIGAIQIIIPEIKDMNGTPQDPDYHPEGDVMEHTLLMLSHLVAPSSELAWSVLLHDCGKPTSFSIGKDDGRMHFYGHEDLGASIALEIMNRFKMSSKACDSVVASVKNHMRISSATKMRKAKVLRMLCSESFPDELELHRVDCISSHRKMDSYLYLLDRFSEFELRPQISDPMVTGTDLIMPD